MDIKITGITEEIMKMALRPGQGRPPAHPRRDGQGARPAPAPSSASTRRASRRINIPTDKIREVIGTGGKVIREIVEKTGAKIDIEDDGTIKVAAVRRQPDRRPRSTGSSGIVAGAGSRRDLHRQGGEDRRLRRLRELPRRPRRPRAHLPNWPTSASPRSTDVVNEGAGSEGRRCSASTIAARCKPVDEASSTRRPAPTSSSKVGPEGGPAAEGGGGRAQRRGERRARPIAAATARRPATAARPGAPTDRRLRPSGRAGQQWDICPQGHCRDRLEQGVR
jgi:hypothetical protein